MKAMSVLIIWIIAFIVLVFAAAIFLPDEWSWGNTSLIVYAILSGGVTLIVMWKLGMFPTKVQQPTNPDIRPEKA